MGLPEPPDLGKSALPPGSFEGHVALVTGGGTGLGKAMALEFGRLGAAVAVMSRKQEHLEAGVHALEKLGARAIAVQADIRQPDQIAAGFDRIESELGLPDTLVNNAAGNFPVPAEDMSPNAWRTVVDIVLNGTFHCAREFARRHIAVGAPGSVINIGASYAWTGGPGFAHSAAAKAGVKNMTETLAVEWAPYGIRVNCLVPGLMPHEDEVAAIRDVPERGQREAARAPAGVDVGLQPVTRPERSWPRTAACSQIRTLVAFAYVTRPVVVSGSHVNRHRDFGTLCGCDGLVLRP